MTEHENITLELDGRDIAVRDNDAEIDETLRNMQKIADESKRAADVAHDAPEILDDLDKKFEAMTGLDKYNYTLLLLAAAIQCVRWYFLNNGTLRLTDKQGDKMMSKIVPKKWQDILLASVPYDAIQGGADAGAGLGGKNHRARTLGHDLILGWIFGPVNILSDSLTKTDFTSFNVENMVITEPIPTPKIFSLAYEQTKAEKWNLPAAIARQMIHFGSDFFTKQGLPVPLIATVVPDLAQTLFMKFHVDMWGVIRSATVAGFINMCIAWLHRLWLYDPEKYSSPEIFEVKTRKILRYSNVIATSSNVFYAAISNDVKRLDVGGILVTLWNLIRDWGFKRKIKEEFVFGQFNAMIRGEGYDFA